MLKAEIVITGRDEQGNLFDFTHHTFNTCHGEIIPDSDFKEYVNEYATKIAIFACSELDEQCDFVSVKCIRFEKIED